MNSSRKVLYPLFLFLTRSTLHGSYVEKVLYPFFLFLAWSAVYWALALCRPYCTFPDSFAGPGTGETVYLVLMTGNCDIAGPSALLSAQNFRHLLPSMRQASQGQTYLIASHTFPGRLSYPRQFMERKSAKRS